ncbi:unnamed protein product [Plasmodium vivax]|uniref:(malaria parasite P. vivax) hypothetical protein n=1 Tax=Plasmodium vivax TaxID=5855 RepID=A0A1G4GWC5_PLAVI|nr:unnamed protein product [Plasmodium vivax]SCO66897.1 conserved Plasmodium protein, unknown function [Plasmodium vivax]
MERVDELDAIKDYLGELNRSAQGLQNANYHRSVLRGTSRKGSHGKDPSGRNPFLRCTQMRRDVDQQFRCIDFDSHSKDSESASTSDDPSGGERRSGGGSPTGRAPLIGQPRKNKTTSQMKEGGGKKKDIRFSLEKRSGAEERSRRGETQTRLIPCGATRKQDEGKSEQAEKAKQTKQTSQPELANQPANFSNERERELFQYLVAKANDEIENISRSLEQKYGEELVSKVGKIKASYESKIKKLLTVRRCLCDEKEQMVKEDKYSKGVIKKLEKKNLLLLHQMEELKKELHLVGDEKLQREVPKWSGQGVLMGSWREGLHPDGLYRDGHQIRDYEKRIRRLNEQLNRTHGDCLAFKAKWEGNERQLHQREEEVSDLQREVHRCLTSKKEVEEKWAHLKGEIFKMEAENDRLRAELKKAKLSAQQLEEDHADACQRKDHLLACYKAEEKKLKEDVQSCKMKCALLENKNQEQLFEKKCKMLQNALKDAENEKSICERICERNENLQRDMRIEIKSLKNELYESRNKIYKISKAGVNIPQGGIFYGDANGMATRGVDPSDGEAVNRERESPRMREDPLGKDAQLPGEQDTTQKIKSIEKQLTLLKLERNNKEGELKRCPTQGGRTEEVRRRESLTKRLQCIDEKITMLDGTLKMIQMSTSDHIT